MLGLRVGQNDFRSHTDTHTHTCTDTCTDTEIHSLDSLGTAHRGSLSKPWKLKDRFENRVAGGTRTSLHDFV